MKCGWIVLIATITFVATFDRLSLPDPRRTRLTRGGKPNPDKLRQLEDDPDLLQIKQIRPPLFHGRRFAIARTATYPVSTTALYRVVSGGQPMVVPLVRQTVGWRVDLRWWLAMTDQLPDGRIVQGTGKDDLKVLVGQMGVVEVPFVAHRIGQTWRIEPQSYFPLLLR